MRVRPPRGPKSVCPRDRLIAVSPRLAGSRARQTTISTPNRMGVISLEWTGKTRGALELMRYKMVLRRNVLWVLILSFVI